MVSDVLERFQYSYFGLFWAMSPWLGGWVAGWVAGQQNSPVYKSPSRAWAARASFPGLLFSLLGVFETSGVDNVADVAECMRFDDF